MGGQYEPLLQDAVTPADHCSPSFVQTLRSLLSVLFCSIKCCMFNFGGKELLTPLDCAAAKHCPELMALLLEAGGMPGDNVLYAAIHEVSLQTEGKGQCAAHAARITHVFMSRAFRAFAKLHLTQTVNLAALRPADPFLWRAVPIPGVARDF